MRGLPTYFNIEISNRCNLACPFCAASRDLMEGKGQDMSLEEFKKIIDDISVKHGYSPTLQIAFRGEPFLNKNASQIIKYAVTKGFFTIVSSNGLLIDSRLNKALIESGLDQLIVSVDAATDKTYSLMRHGGDFSKLISNIRDMAKQKKELKSKKPFLELQFIVTKDNENEIKEFISLVRTLKADNIKFKSYKLTCFGRGDESVKTLKGFFPKTKYLRYKIKNGELVPKNAHSSCSWAFDCLVYVDGDVGPCCEDYNKKYVVGNIFERNFWELWKSAEYRKLRKIVKSRGLEICKTCS
jgi:MoaA/NifB/PqqE/SkfB family radical SAM enzyme